LSKKESFNAGAAAKKILSAIVRTENRFGKKYIIDLLSGKKTQRIAINKHDKLSVFGAARNYPEDKIDQIIKLLTDSGHVSKSEGTYPVLSISKKGEEFLKTGGKLEMSRPHTEKTAAGKNLDYNRELFDLLRRVRKDMADKENVPPFVIFGDRALQEMAHYFPQKLYAFSRINGVGSKKLEKYGDIFISAIRQFIKENGIPEQGFAEKDKSDEEVRTVSVGTKFYARTHELLIKKIPIKRIAKAQNYKLDTIVNHIEKLIDDGVKLDLEYLKLPKDRYLAMTAAFRKCGDEKLKPVFEYLKGRYAYEELKLARVLMRY